MGLQSRLIVNVHALVCKIIEAESILFLFYLFTGKSTRKYLSNTSASVSLISAEMAHSQFVSIEQDEQDVVAPMFDQYEY